MKMIVEYFVMFMFILVFLWVGTSCVTQNLYFSNTKEYYEGVKTRIENSDFASSVIEDCKTQATNDGYTLDVTDNSVYSEAKTYQLKLTFTYKLPLIGFEKDYNISGFAG